MKARLDYHDLVRTDATALLPPRGGRVLDFGGGIGATGASLKESGRADSVVLFDQIADAALPVIDATEALDFDDVEGVSVLAERHGPFDTILALDVLEHLRDPWGVIGVLAKSLAPGGRMIVSLPNVASAVVLGPLLLKDEFTYVEAGVMDRTHLRWFTRKSAVAMVEGAGLAPQRVVRNPFSRKYKLARVLTLGLFDRFLAKQWIVLATKPA